VSDSWNSQGLFKSLLTPGGLEGGKWLGRGANGRPPRLPGLNLARNPGNRGFYPTHPPGHHSRCGHWNSAPPIPQGCFTWPLWWLQLTQPVIPANRSVCFPSRGNRWLGNMVGKGNLKRLKTEGHDVCQGHTGVCDNKD
jgi:hypothetical protein